MHLNFFPGPVKIFLSFSGKVPIKNSLCLFFNEIALSQEILRKVLRAYVGLKDSILDVIASLFAVCIGRKKQTEKKGGGGEDGQKT